jgi:hypothetical protein
LSSAPFRSAGFIANSPITANCGGKKPAPHQWNNHALVSLGLHPWTIGGDIAMHTAQIISSHPDVHGSISKRLIECIDECYACAQACHSCADACLAEEMIDELRQCIRLNLDCADVCELTAKLAARRTGSDEDLIISILDVCAEACIRCAEECSRHAAMHEHCRICADACYQCEAACRDALPDVQHPEYWH